MRWQSRKSLNGFEPHSGTRRSHAMLARHPSTGSRAMAMTTAIVKRRLAAIFCADVAGYTRLMNADAAATLRLLAAHREVTDRLIAQHDGRIANTAGDSILAEFPNALDAAQCALAIQERLAVVNAEMPEARRLSFRIGIHVGEAMVRDGDLFGDSVNVAARMQSLAEPGCICLSGSAHDYVHRTLPVIFEDLGPQQVKNLDKPVQCYRLRPSDTPSLRAIPPVHRRNEANLMRRCHEMMRKELAAVTVPEGLEPLELAMLASLADVPGIDADRLASRVGIYLSDPQRFLEHLARLDLVAREGAGWSVTKKGSELAGRLRAPVHAAIDRVMAPLSDSEREILINLLARVIKANEAKTEAG